MAVTTTMIEKRDYNLIGILDDEIDMLDSFKEYSEYNGYIGDAITELADSYIPIYNGDVWENASDIQEYIEEAIAQGLVSVKGNDIDLVKIFRAGYYQYYTQSLYDNLDTLAFNIVAEKVNEHLNTMDEDALAEIDFYAIESAIEDETNNFCNNNQMSSMDDIANEIIENIKNCEYEN